jgi:ABC-type glycerol-3-phosphate transport system substrate-binding protein
MPCCLRFLVIGLGILPLSACQTEPAGPLSEERPLAGQTVELLAPDDLVLRDLWEPLLQEWQAQTGGTVVWSEYKHEQLPWKDNEPLTEGPNGGRLVLVSLTELADADAAGFLSPFPPVVTDHVDAKDIFPGLKDTAVSRQKKLIAVPLSAPVLLCYYRKDLLDAAGLTPPRTWEQYQDLLNKLPEWAPGLMALEPCGPEFRSSLFLARSVAFAKHPQNYSVWFDIQTGEPLFNSPAFERALDTARKAWGTMPADIWQASPAECRRSLLTGKAALVLSWEPSSAYPRIRLSTKETASLPPEPFPIGIVPLPGTRLVYQSSAKRWEEIGAETPYQPGFVGFTGLVMGVRAENDRAGAWNLLQMLVAHRDRVFAECPRSICRESETFVPPLDSGELSPETISEMADATAETLRRRDVTFDLAIPNAQVVRAIIADELESAKDESRPTVEILAAIQRRVSDATQENRTQFRDAYRRSVGLAPAK